MSERPRILIIEDEAEFAEMMKIRLEIAGYRAVIAQDTASGVAAVREGRPDLILLDLMIPGEGGFSVLEQIKDIRDEEEIPVIVVTGKTLTPEVHALVGAYRVSAVFTKPYEPETFLARIRTLIGPGNPSRSV